MSIIEGEAGAVRLSGLRIGDRGVIVGVRAEPSSAVGAIDCAELERRLLEFGFVEGARIEVLHEGAFGRDPVAVKLDDMRVGLRRREAYGVLVRLEGSAA